MAPQLLLPTCRPDVLPLHGHAMPIGETVVQSNDQPTVHRFVPATVGERAAAMAL